MNRAAVADLYRSVAAGSIYGEDVLSAIQWHTSPVNMEKILHALYPHLEQLGQLLLRLAPSVCIVALLDTLFTLSHEYYQSCPLMYVYNFIWNLYLHNKHQRSVLAMCMF